MSKFIEMLKKENLTLTNKVEENKQELLFLREEYKKQKEIIFTQNEAIKLLQKRKSYDNCLGIFNIRDIIKEAVIEEFGINKEE